MSLISVIVPVYKVEKYLDKCVRSIQAQTINDIEIILVDDGSPDNCGKMCDEYASLDSRIRVVHKSNGGLSSARNAGIEIAKSKYIGFVDSDDYISPDMYELLLTNMENEHADISMCACYDCFHGVDPKINKPFYSVMNAENALELMYSGKYFGFAAWNKLYKKSLFENVKYPEGRTSEDLYIIVDLMLRCSKVVATSEQKYYYIHREGSITASKSLKTPLDTLGSYEKNLKLIKENFPSLILIAENAVFWAKSSLLDSILMLPDDEKVKYKDKENELVLFFRKNIFAGLFKYKLTMPKKISLFVLFFNRKLYKSLVLFNRRKYCRN